ncbi:MULTISPECIES: hypothetical protein [Vagococcus]|uniref:hypothetical protein n=1 Tax=Vagococcus TaxID=2737 RepID=UPI002FC8D1A2
MSDKEWLVNEMMLLARNSSSYEEQAFFQELEKIVEEQFKRIEQAEAELDGTMWSPRKW